MSAPVSVVHHHGERITVTACGTELMSYVYKPDPVGFESRKPYAHPLRTLSGNTVTGYRPHDHRWHKGLQMTASRVSGQNFWGGNTYIPGEGYRALPERIGSMRHEGFDAFDAAPDRLAFTERLTWTENGGRPWAEERRGVVLHSVEPEEGAWALDWSIHLTSVWPEPLRFGSPTTAGREMAGYTGLHWRGSRDLTGGAVLGPDGRSGEAELMGQQAPWLGFTGEHDETDGRSTVVLAHAPENAGAIHESHWFVRSEPAPSVAASWAFFEEFELGPGESFRYRYRVVVADGGWDRERIERYLGTHPW